MKRFQSMTLALTMVLAMLIPFQATAGTKNTGLENSLNGYLDNGLQVSVNSNVITTDKKDPWGQPYQFIWDNESDSILMLSSGPDKIANTEDDLVLGVSYDNGVPMVATLGFDLNKGDMDAVKAAKLINLSSEEESKLVADYNSLTNKPKINGIILSGNKTASELGLATRESVTANTTAIALLNGSASTSGSVQNQIATALESLEGLSFSVVDGLPAEGDENILYLVKVSSATGDDKYKEYVYTDTGYIQIGDTSIDLSGYIKKSDLNDYVKKTDNLTAPTGEIISMMGKTAPAGYLACDGTVYNISDYKTLADYIKAQFGSYNYFGGNGTTTFAVPNLQGEFLRGTGANSHEKGGSGAAVGEHQDATELPYWCLNNSTNEFYIQGTMSSGFTVPHSFDSTIDCGAAKRVYYKFNTNSSVYLDLTHYTTRPTNTSVLYCIKT